MYSAIFSGVLVLSILTPINVVSAPEPPLFAQNLPTVKTSSPEWIKSRIAHYSQIYGVSEDVMNFIIKCESNYNPHAWGDAGHSRGLVQIHYPSHENISDEQALDIEFSLDFLAKNLKEGNGKLWTCYKMLPESPS